jgi:hypothetical protein
MILKNEGRFLKTSYRRGAEDAEVSAENIFKALSKSAKVKIHFCRSGFSRDQRYGKLQSRLKPLLQKPPRPLRLCGYRF